MASIFIDNSTSSMSKAAFSHRETTFLLEHDQGPEESTWTMYFEDFLANGQETGDGFGCDRSSLVSDAASRVGAEKIARKGGDRLRRSSKKRRTVNAGVPPAPGKDLEDTASSPASSSKGYSMTDQLEENPTSKEIKDATQVLEEKGGVSSHMTGRNEMEFDRLEDRDLTALKKRGLCLVPLALLFNHLG